MSTAAKHTAAASGSRSRSDRSRNPCRLESDFAQLAGCDRNVAAEEKADVRSRISAGQRATRAVEHILMIRKQRSEIRAIAGGLDNDFECLVCPVVEMHVRSGDSQDTGTDRYHSAPNTIDGPNVQKRNFSVLHDLRHGPLCGRRRPNFSKSPIASRRMGALSVSTRDGGSDR